MRAGANRFADWIDRGEKLLYDVVSDETDRRMMEIVGFGDVAAGVEADVAKLGIVGGGAHHVGVFQELVAVAEVFGDPAGGGDAGGDLHVVMQELKFVEGEERAALGF